MKEYLRLSPEVVQAQAVHTPIVALESTVITHGLPYPENLQIAQDMEAEIRQQGIIPAIIAILDGVINVGLNLKQLEYMTKKGNLSKASPRDFSRLIRQKGSGGTTVAGTIFVAHQIGIQVFATGGIGGVHRQNDQDVSADLLQLSQTPMIVICSGAKAILDLPATLEWLETFGVPVVGYKTDEFPAFYTIRSHLPVSSRVGSPEEVVEMAHTHWQLGLRSALLVAVPPPREVALPEEEMEEAIKQALQEAKKENIRGQVVTPFLLQRVSELTSDASLRANLGLLRNNARLAAQIAGSLWRNRELKAI